MKKLLFYALIITIIDNIYCNTKCHNRLIYAYKNTSYNHVMHSTKQMFYQLKNCVTSAPNDTKLHPNNRQCKKILNTCHGMITCANPRYPGQGLRLSRADIRTLEKRMEYYFKCRQFAFIRSNGYYDGYHIPNSYIVLNIGESEAIALAQSFAQHSVVLFNKKRAKLLHLQGKYKNYFYNATSWIETLLKQDNFTLINTKDGPFKFSYNFDLSNHHKMTSMEPSRPNVPAVVSERSACAP